MNDDEFGFIDPLEDMLDQTSDLVDRVQARIDSLGNQIQTNQAMLEKMMSMLSPEQKEQVKPHLTLVKSND